MVGGNFAMPNDTFQIRLDEEHMIHRTSINMALQLDSRKKNNGENL